MSDDMIERLRRELAGRYRIERELGKGGMATVYLAHDERLNRAVAIKVLLPELSSVLGPERFLREIDVAARLNHPGILPLYDSGDAGGLLFFVMPYAEGESLETRLVRETQLPIADAVQLGAEVADALDYAHSQGVVHRDIKPANILISGGHARVADFGIARVIGQVEAQKLTSTGFALGTPAYMSPEQSTATAPLDGRSDVYSLGCVMYEMLIGGPPFQGPTLQVIIARHAAEPITGLRHIRDTIPDDVEHAVVTSLAKMPADRFATAGEFAAALRNAGPRRSARRRQRKPWAAVAGGALLAVAAGAATLSLLPGKESEAPLDRTTVVVMPFRAGADAADDRRIAADMADLLYQRLPAGEGLAAVYPGSVRAAVSETGLDPVSTDLPEDQARAIARKLGAGSVVLGHVARSDQRLTLGAVLLDVTTGRELARAEGIAGFRDSLAPLADRLAATLLVRRSREPAGRHPALLATTLGALRAYLAGQAAFAGGDYDAATASFRTALSRDTSLVPAALGYLAAAKFGDQPTDSVARAAWSRRERLGPNDRLQLVAMLGPRYPSPPTDSETVQGWEQAVDAMSDRSDIWYLLGEALFHAGPRLGIARALERAGTAFRRAVEIDSSFAPALLHLIDVAASARDTIALRSLMREYLALDSTGELATYVRWRAAGAVSDQAATAALEGAWDQLQPAALERIISVAQIDGRSMADAQRAVATFQRMIASGEVSARSRTGLALRVRWVSIKMRELARNRGRPAEALAIARSQQATLAGSRDRLSAVVEALFWDADTALAAEAAAQSRRMAPASGATPAALDPFFDICAAGLWSVARGDAAWSRGASARLRSARRAADDTQSSFIPVCAALLDAWSADLEQRADAGRRLEELEAMMRAGPPALTWILSAANLTLARLHEARGDLPRALAAVRRRPSFSEYGEPRFLVALSSLLREEARLAALTGDRETAARAQAHITALRAGAEPD